MGHPVLGRNVRVYHAGQAVELAGFWQHGQVTAQTFHNWILEVLYVPVPDGQWGLFPTDPGNPAPLVASGPVVLRNDEVLPPGNYVVLKLETSTPIDLFLRVLTIRRRAYTVNPTYTARTQKFIDRVRERDLRCCFSGKVVLLHPRTGHNFVGFEAAHIWPLSDIDEFIRRGYRERYFTDPEVHTDEDALTSVQNGFLCQVQYARLFDDFQIGVNPDDGYRITDFCERDGQSEVDGLIFWRNLARPASQHPIDELFRHHFQQCLWVNLRAMAEPQPDHYFDPEVDLGPGGFDLSNPFWNSHIGHDQLDTELRSRLFGLSTDQASEQAGGDANCPSSLVPPLALAGPPS